MPAVVFQFVSSLIPSSLQTIAASASIALLNAIWQGTAIAASLWLCLKLAPRTPAAYRFALWSAAFVALLALPLLPNTPHLQAPQAQIAAPSATPLLQINLNWTLAIAALWLAASLYRAADLAVHAVRLRRLWKSATPVDSSAITLPTTNRTAQVCTTSHLQKPGVIGFFSPRILIPDWLFARLTPGELNQIVLHETEHLRRADDWTNLLQKLALILFPLNPALLWIERRLCAEREMACDEGVIRITHAPRAYAACLASLAERGLTRRSQTAALSLGAWHRRPELARRVHSILLRQQSLGAFASASLLTVFGGALLFGSAELSRCSQWIAIAPTEAATGNTNLAQSPTQAAQMEDAAFSPATNNSAPQPHLTRLKAILPQPPQARNPRQAYSRKAATQPSDRLLSGSEARKASPGFDQQPGWIVLTTWEQLPAAQAQPETDQAEAQQSTQPDQPSTTGQNRVAVTQLIFRVLPTRLNSPSTSSQPTVTVRGGWIVFQL